MPTRRFFPIKEKLMILQEAMESPGNIKPTARKYGITPSTLRQWRNQLGQLEKAAPSSLTLHRGRPPAYSQLEEDLVKYVEQQEALQMAITPRHLVSWILQRQPDFQGRNYNKSIGWVYRFLKRNDLSMRCVTKEAQTTPAEATEIVEDFLGAFHQDVRASGVTPSLIVNMNQMAVHLDMPPKRLITKKGSRTVAVAVPKSNNPRVTVYLAVSLSGEKLPPMVIYKGKQGAPIHCEIRQFKTGNVHAVQQKAWCDQDLMNHWIEKVWAPFIVSKADNGRSILILDSFSVHRTSATAAQLARYGTEVYTIPAKMTSQLQILDGGINKLMKDYIMQSWIDSRISGQQGDEEAESGDVQATREQLSQWIADGWARITPEMILKTCAHIGLIQ